MSEEYTNYSNESQENYNQSSYNQNNYSQGQNYNYNQGYNYNEPKKPKKKGGVGKVVAITLGMVLLAGVAAAGGYSAHTIINEIRGGLNGITADNDNVTGETEKETQAQIETLPQTTTAVAQGSLGTVILTDVSDVVEKVMPSVVAITNSSVYTSQGFGFWGTTTEIPTESSGSGIIIGQNDTELLIVTNNHVIEDNNSLTVQFADNSTAEAVVKGADASNDIAIISVKLETLTAETKSSIAIATLGDSDALRMGQGVIAIGNALGYGQSVTEGCVSALEREVTTDEGTTLKVLQTSAAINPGNSGGALLNVNGEVIGINTAKVAMDDVEGIGYAIPISSVKDLIDDMMNWETLEKVSEEDACFLGIQNPQSVDSQSAAIYGMPMGVFIYAVAEDSPAEAAGLRAKDIITGFDRYTISSVSDLNDAMEYFAGGDTVVVTVQRQVNGTYQEFSVEVTLAYKRDVNLNQ